MIKLAIPFWFLVLHELHKLWHYDGLLEDIPNVTGITCGHSVNISAVKKFLRTSHYSINGETPCVYSILKECLVTWTVYI